MEGSKSFFSAVKDRTRYAMASSDIELAVVKATNRDLSSPKEKHVRAIIAASNDRYTPQINILHLIYYRTNEREWIIVLKAMILLHRLSREGSVKFFSILSQEKVCAQVFQKNNFIDRDHIDLSQFIRQYSVYLRIRTQTIRSIKWDPSRGAKTDTSKLTDVDNKTLFIVLQSFQRLFNALFKIPFRKAKLSNPAVEAAFVQCLQDTVRIFPAINDGLLLVLDRFFKMDPQEAQTGLTIYKNSSSQVENLTDFFSIAKFLGLQKTVPQLKGLNNPSLINQMEQFIASGTTNSPTAESNKDLPPVANATTLLGGPAHPIVTNNIQTPTATWTPFGTTAGNPTVVQTPAAAVAAPPGNWTPFANTPTATPVSTSSPFAPTPVANNFPTTNSTPALAGSGPVNDFLKFEEGSVNASAQTQSGPVIFDPLADPASQVQTGESVPVKYTESQKGGTRADQISLLKQMSLNSQPTMGIANAITGAPSCMAMNTAPTTSAPAAIPAIDPFANPTLAGLTVPPGAMMPGMIVPPGAMIPGMMAPGAMMPGMMAPGAMMPVGYGMTAVPPATAASATVLHVAPDVTGASGTVSSTPMSASRDTTQLRGSQPTQKNDNPFGLL